jgi:hypothetical protein
LLSGIYLILVAVASYGLGGYVAGLLRERFATTGTPASPAGIEDEADMRDGLHGLIVWAFATLLTALLLLAAIPATARLAAPSGGTSGPSSSVAGENLVAFDVDRLLRGDRRQGEDIGYTRAEIARILLTSSSHSGVAAEDRAYLIRLVAARTGLAAAEAERRVDASLGSARENIARGRRSSVILAFMAGAAALVGAAAAWYAAIAGGEQRDDKAPPRRWRVLVARTRIRR